MWEFTLSGEEHLGVKHCSQSKRTPSRAGRWGHGKQATGGEQSRGWGSSSCLWAGGAAFRADVCCSWKESTPHCNMGNGWPLGACCCACPEQHREDQKEVLTNTGVFVEIDVHPCCGMVHIPDVPTQNPASVQRSSTVHCVHGGGKERRCARERWGRPGIGLTRLLSPALAGASHAHRPRCPQLSSGGNSLLPPAC